MRRRHTSRPAIGAGLLSVVALLSTGAAGHAGPLEAARELVVSGSGTKMASFTVRSELAFDRADVTLTLGGGATYGGVVFISSVGWKGYGGGYRITALEKLEPPDPVPVWRSRPYDLPGPHGDQVVLVPGTYRVYLFGDGTTEYRVPLKTGAALTLRPSRAARSSLHAEERLLPPDPDADRDRTVLSRWVTRPNAAITHMKGMLTGPGLTTGATVRVCMSRRPGCTRGVTLGPRDVAAHGSSTAGTFVWPGYTIKTNGRYQAVADFTSDRSVATTVVLALLQVEF